jgi:hypothetical protein
MDALLKELQKENPDPDNVNSLACALFITTEGRPNFAQMNEFERYAPCKIFCAERDSYGWLIGGIKYNGKKYYFG